MSYFATRRSDAVCLQDLSAGDEVADGVVVERRSVLWLTAGAVGTLLTGGLARAQGPKTPAAATATAPVRTKLEFEQFLAELLPAARRLVASGGEDEEAYLMTVAAALTRLRDPQAPLRQAMQSFRKRHADDGQRLPIAAVSMTLKPGRGFSHHDHFDYNGVILGVDGEVRIRNYDFQGEVPPIESRETFLLRQTRDDLILPGRISTLSRKRENVHDLVAGKEGARVLDVFTFFSKNATSRYLDVEPKPRDAEARLYEAAWKPRRRRR